MSATVLEIQEDKNKQVFDLKKKGKTAKEIAAILSLNPAQVYAILRTKKTTKNRRKNSADFEAKFQERIEQLQREIEAQKTAKIDAENEVKKLQNQIEILRENFAEKLKENKQQFDDLYADEKDTFNTEIARLQRQLDDAKIIAKIESENGEKLKLKIEQLQGEILQGKIDKKTVQNEVEKLLQKIEENKAEFDAEKERFQSELETAKNEAKSEAEKVKVLRAQLDEKNTEIKRLKSVGNRLVKFIHSDGLVNAVMLVLCIALAHAITAPIFEYAGVDVLSAHIIALGADIAAFIFLSRGQHIGGIAFAILAGIQVLIITHGLDWLTDKVLDYPKYIKSFALALAVGGAIYGFGKIISGNTKADQ